MKNTTTTAPITITEKLKWLENRYWKFGDEENLADNLFDLYEVDDDGRMTSQPRRDPLTGETRGLMVLGASGNGKTALLKRALRVDSILTKFRINHDGTTLFSNHSIGTAVMQLECSAWPLASNSMGVIHPTG
ncbi:hypothetical protein [Loktanella salsilacus]|uniref:hypothetical protein n=1 Tax=Loktanella salsilacus TaxID=195913 RepID=UPI0037048D76